MIEAIAFAIAVLGAVLLLILFARIRAVDAELKLKKHRSKDAGLADLLNYAAVVDDGVIVGKNGSFMAAWLYKGMTTPAAPMNSGKWCRSASTRRSSGPGQWLDGACRCRAPPSSQLLGKGRSTISPIRFPLQWTKSAGGCSRAWARCTRVISSSP
jgi:hypothetical protein